MTNVKLVKRVGSTLACGAFVLAFQGCGSEGYVTTEDTAVVTQAVSCPTWPPAKPNADFCTESCPCDHGQGDCDVNSECLPGLSCVQNNGPQFGYPATYDMCACPTFNASNPNPNFCTENCPCSEGQGGCTDDSQCAEGLECHPNQGATWGLPANYGVCEQPDTSGCPVFNPATPDGSFCTVECPCAAGEGDCDSNAECESGLVCRNDNGATYGLPATYDACEPVDCGTFDPGNPDGSFCSEVCPCAAGEGDCDRDSECQSGHVCVQNNGATYGLPANYDVCEEREVPTCGTFDPGNPDTNFCNPDCRCAAGEGDCDTDSDCASGLVCHQNNGALFGLPPSYDACIDPASEACGAFNPSQPDASFCTAACPCAAGEGDCDSDQQCEDGLTCVNNRGATYGLPATYDVCE